MQPTWAVFVSTHEAESVAALRLGRGIEICEIGGAIWLRGASNDEKLDVALRKLPGAERFTVLIDGQLQGVGKRVPKGRLPDGNWIPLDRWITLEPQPAALRGETSGRVELRLVRSSAEHEPNVLVTHMERWAAYARGAPKVRLERLRFAAAADGRVLVRGTPLPPIAGERLVERDRIAVPCGLELSPRVEPAVLHELLELGPNDVALFAADGSFERVPGEHFVRATRSAVRASAEAGRMSAEGSQ